MASSITWKTRTFIASSSKRAIPKRPARSLSRWRTGEAERTISRSSSRAPHRPPRREQDVRPAERTRNCTLNSRAERFRNRGRRIAPPTGADASRSGGPLDQERRMRPGDGSVKRTYFLVAIASLQIILGSITLIGAAQPVRTAENVVVLSGSYFLYDFGILGTGRLSGNLTELNSQSFDLFVFDDAGYASFRDGSNTVAPVFRWSGTSIVFNVNLTGSGQYHVVAVDVPQRRELQIHLDLVVVGLKTGETIVALIVLVGGLAFGGATLILSVWSWRRTRSAPAPAPAPDPASDPFPDPPLDPLPDPLPEPQEAAQDPPNDNTRIY